MPVTAVREVLIVETCTPVPGAPANVLGVVNRRGAILPVLDLRPLLDVPPRPLERGARLLVVRLGAVEVGVAIDEVLGLEVVDERSPVALLDPDRILGAVGLGPGVGAPANGPLAGSAGLAATRNGEG
jgi:purine-binding chemotaxis protein CheW